MVRIVKLTFRENETDRFVAIFNEAKRKIRASEGCKALQLIRDRKDPRIFMTYSVWQTPNDLQQYRRSELFKSVWTQVTPLFEESPEAWSLDKLDDL